MMLLGWADGALITILVRTGLFRFFGFARLWRRMQNNSYSLNTVTLCTVAYLPTTVYNVEQNLQSILLSTYTCIESYKQNSTILCASRRASVGQPFWPSWREAAYQCQNRSRRWDCWSSCPRPIWSPYSSAATTTRPSLYLRSTWCSPWPS